MGRQIRLKNNKGEIGEFVKEVIFDGLPSQKSNSFLQGLNNTNRNTVSI